MYFACMGLCAPHARSAHQSQNEGFTTTGTGGIDDF